MCIVCLFACACVLCVVLNLYTLAHYLSHSVALLLSDILAISLSLSQSLAYLPSHSLQFSLMYSLAHQLSWILAISLSLSIFPRTYTQHTSAQSRVCCSVSHCVAVSLLRSGNLALAPCFSPAPHQSASATDVAASHAYEQAPPNYCTFAAPLHSAPPVRVCVCMCVCSACVW